MRKILNFINKNKYKKIIYIILVLIFLLLLFILIYIFRDKDKYIYEYLDEQNKNIVVKDTIKEKTGTFIRSLDSLSKEHCINDICIKKVIIYYIGDEGRIEYEITNKSKKKVSGALKLEFDNDKTTYIIYNKLKKKETVKGTISFTGTDLSNVYNYKLYEVEKDELKKLLNKK